MTGCASAIGLEHCTALHGLCVLIKSCFCCTCSLYNGWYGTLRNNCPPPNEPVTDSSFANGNTNAIAPNNDMSANAVTALFI